MFTAHQLQTITPTPGLYARCLQCPGPGPTLLRLNRTEAHTRLVHGYPFGGMFTLYRTR